MTTRQLRFVVPQEQELYPLEVRTGIDAGAWLVDRQVARTSSGIFMPSKEGLTLIRTYDIAQNDPALLEAGFELVPVTVLLYGIQNDRDFCEMLEGTNQLTGSGVVDYRLLGTPNVNIDDLRYREDSLQYQGLRNDRPIARIEPQNGQVTRLDKTTLWGVKKDSKINSEKPNHLTYTYMYNDNGNRFVSLNVQYSGVDVIASWHPLERGFDGGVRLAKRVESWRKEKDEFDISTYRGRIFSPDP